MDRKYRIVIAEDHTIVREGLTALLESGPDMDIVGEARDGLETVRAVARLQPDLLLLDLSMPKMDGISVIREIRSQSADTKIIVLTFHAQDEYILAAFDSGADGYCLKNDSYRELITAIHMVLDGKTYISPDISGKVLEGYLEGKKTLKTETSWESLTQREKEVLKLVGEGYKSAEIAGMLFISPKTVDKHRSNIMHKLDRHNAAELTVYAVEKGLVVRT